MVKTETPFEQITVNPLHSLHTASVNTSYHALHAWKIRWSCELGEVDGGWRMEDGESMQHVSHLARGPVSYHLHPSRMIGYRSSVYLTTVDHTTTCY